jgi:adenosylcobinamide-GDP ribazoletransferase
MRDNLNLFARRFVLALQTSTRVRPAGAATAAPPDADLLQASAGHVPGAGWLVGLAACLVFALTSILLRGNTWEALVAAVACTVATALLTGALNESGLFRTAERLGRRDAGIGPLALFLLLAAKLALLAALAATAEAAVMATLFAGHVVSRFAPLVAAHWLDTSEPALRNLRTGALWCVVPLLLMFAAGGVAFLVVPLLACALAGFAFVRLVAAPSDPVAGERAGALQQACEVAFYLGAALAA